MKIRGLVVVAGIAGAVALIQLYDAASADPAQARLAQTHQLLASYAQTNEKVATCMKGKGLAYDAGLAEAEVIDAFDVIPKNEVTEKIREELAARKAAAAKDPNGSLMAKMSPQTQSLWTAAANECNEQVEFELSGGAEGRAKVAKAKQAALESPDVKAAAKVYVNCMLAKGFTVDTNPFVAPQEVSAAKQRTAAEIEMLDKYNSAWDACAQPWQQVYDHKLFG